jgi:hypothetical protein
MEVWSLVISATALAISGTTAWFTLWRRGKLMMTRPTMIFFGYDYLPHGRDPKVVIRTLLYSTAYRGQVVEAMYAKLKKGELVQDFSFWGCAEDKAIIRGSGLHVGQNGIGHYHHFVSNRHGPQSPFLAGEQVLQVFASQPANSKPKLLFETTLHLDSEQAEKLQSGKFGLMFDWDPESKKYKPDLDMRRGNADVRNLFAGELQ